jgi:hypothetical protein
MNELNDLYIKNGSIFWALIKLERNGTSGHCQKVFKEKYDEKTIPVIRIRDSIFKKKVLNFKKNLKYTINRKGSR